jgi:hypothetical protein
MSGTAVFRPAARRALRPTTTRFRRTLVANNEQPFSPMDIITPRRHYSAGGVNMEEVITAAVVYIVSSSPLHPASLTIITDRSTLFGI